MRHPLVFVSESSRLREIVALYLITTTEDDIMLISQTAQASSNLCGALWRSARIGCALPNPRNNQHRSCRLCANNGHRVTSHEGTLNPRASTSTTAVQPYENFVSFGPCVRTTDQKQTSERGPAFAKYQCKTTRCEVDPPRFLLASWSVHSLRGSSEQRKKSKQEGGPATQKFNQVLGCSPRFLSEVRLA